MALKKRKLEQEEIAWNEFCLVGISSSMHDYTLCFHLNEIIQADFFRKENHVLYSKLTGKNEKYHVYEWQDESTNVNYMLFANRSEEKAVLLPEVSQVEFILKITGDSDLQQLLDGLKALESIRSATLLQAIKLKSAVNNLIYYPETEQKKNV